MVQLKLLIIIRKLHAPRQMVTINQVFVIEETAMIVVRKELGIRIQAKLGLSRSILNAEKMIN